MYTHVHTHTGALVFGCLPAELVQVARSGEDAESRVRAVADMQHVFESLQTGTDVLPHLQPLLSMLCALMQDVNLKVIVGAMECTGVLVRKLGWPVRNHVDLLVNKLAEVLGDSKIVVRQGAARLVNRLMHTLTPAPVLHILLKHLTAASWRVREEVINVVIVAVSTFMPDRFDFEQLTQLLVPALKDKRSRIKFVAIEALAVIANVVGTKQMWALLDQHTISEPVKQSIRERLQSSSELPAITDDGMVRPFPLAVALFFFFQRSTI